MRTLSMIATILLLFSFGHRVRCEAIAAESASAPLLSASSAALYERNSHTFVFTKDAEERRPMASTTKIMTALVAVNRAKSLDEIVTVPPEAVGVEGSSLYLREGERLTLSDLLYGLMLQSANDAAVAIAIHVTGSVDAFVAEMNETASELGLTDTSFTNPHGLHDENHYTTACDLAKIAAAALEDEIILKISSTYKHTIPQTNLSPARHIVNHNKLLRLCDSAVGLKTGFTKASGRCLVGAFETDGLSLVSVTLSAPNDWDDHQKLLAYGRSRLESRCIASRGSLHYRIPIVGAELDFISCTNSEDVVLVLPRGKDAPIPRLHLSHFAVAPIRCGAVMGTLIYETEGGVGYEIPLVAERSVDPIRQH